MPKISRSNDKPSCFFEKGVSPEYLDRKSRRDWGRDPNEYIRGRRRYDKLLL